MKYSAVTSAAEAPPAIKAAANRLERIVALMKMKTGLRKDDCEGKPENQNAMASTSNLNPVPSVAAAGTTSRVILGRPGIPERT